MFIKRLSVCLLNVLLCIIQGNTNGQTRYCLTRTPVVNICTISEVLMTPNVFIDTDNVHSLQENVCTCTISPASSNVLFLLTYRQAPRRNEDFHIRFKLNDVVLTKAILVANTTLSETNELVLETSAKFNKEGVCLIISTADSSYFNISCQKPISRTTKWSTKSVTHYTVSSMETFGGGTNASSDKGNDVDISIIGPAVGGAVGGVVCLIIIIVVIICCRRKALTKKHKHAAETEHNDNNEAPRNNDDDYYMTENPMYNQTDFPKYSQINQNEDYLIGTNENDGRLSHNEYESVPESSIDVHFPLTQSRTGEEDNATVTQQVAQTTENDYHVIGDDEKDSCLPSNQ